MNSILRTEFESPRRGNRAGCEVCRVYRGVVFLAYVVLVPVGRGKAKRHEVRASVKELGGTTESLREQVNTICTFIDAIEWTKES